jgi:transposase InsO family protein
MTGNKAIIKNYSTINVPVKEVITAGNQKLKVEGFGNVPIRDGVYLDKVLYIPELGYNLLSVSSLIKKGVELVFAGDTCKIKNNERVVLIAKQKGELFIVEPEIKGHALYIPSSTKPTDEQWHCRLGHLGINRMKKLKAIAEVLKNVPIINTFQCESCIVGKQTKHQFKPSTRKTSCPGELIHSDVMGPLPKTKEGVQYCCTFIDDYTGHCALYLLKKKSSVYDAFIKYQKDAERQHDHKIKCLRTDNGGEYVNGLLKKHLESHGIRHEFTVASNPQQNGKAERYNRTLCELTRTMLHKAELPTYFWPYSIKTANYLLNCTNLKPIGKDGTLLSSYTSWTGHTPDFNNFRIWGCICYMHIPKENRSNKFAPNSEKRIFVGYDLVRKAYLLYNPKTKQCDSKIHVVFLEDKTGGSLLRELSSKVHVDDIEQNNPVEQTIDYIPLTQDHVTIPTEKSVTPTQQSVVEIEMPLSTQPVVKTALKDQPLVTSSQRVQEETTTSLEEESSCHDAMITPITDTIISANVTRPVVHQSPYPHFVSSDIASSFLLGDEGAFMHHFAGLTRLDEPESFREARQSDEWEHWKKATDSEYNSLIDNDTWELAQLPKGRKAIKTKWIWKKKFDKNGNIERHKARLVAKGFTQKSGIDYTDTFSPVVKFVTIRILLALAAKFDWEIEQMDFVTAFLNGELEEEIYIEQPEGYIIEGQKDKVLRLKKSLYGLKQSPREWNKKLHKHLTDVGYKRLLTDYGVYVKHSGDDIIILAVYVDDLVIFGNNKSKINDLKLNLAEVFKIKDLGELKFILGIEVIRNRKEKTITITQRQYIKNVLERFEMINCKPVRSPLDPNIKLKKEENAEPLSTSTPYMEAVGSLIYAMVATRPDIGYATGLVSRYMSNPKRTHWLAVKHILRYLKGTMNYGITYKGNSSNPLIGYSDSDWASDVDDRKSTSGNCFVLCDGAVSWFSKKQATVARSTVEAEYVSLGNACTEAVWIAMFLKETNLAKFITDPKMMISGSSMQINDKCTKGTKRKHHIEDEATDDNLHKKLKTDMGLSHPAQVKNNLKQNLNEGLQITILGDNQGSIALAKDPKNHARTKHIDIQYHFIRELVERKQIHLAYISTNEMVADVLTKSLAPHKHEQLITKLGIQDVESLIVAD